MNKSSRNVDFSVQSILWSKVKYAWFYITEKCPLSCEYCFFKDRSNQANNISLDIVKTILKNLPKTPNTEFIISGGEPFLYPDLIKLVSLLIRKKFTNNILVIQTSGFLIKKEFIPFLKKNKIRIEIGIDGGLEAMSQHRCGINKQRFQKIKENIMLLQKNGISICPTMAVHPQQAQNLWKNFLVLKQLGLSNIDISPVFLGKWTDFQTRNFKKQYLKITNYILHFQKFGLLSYGYDKPLSKNWKELNILPFGGILPSWVFMSLPVDFKRKYFLAKVNSIETKIYEKNLIFFQKKANDFFSDCGLRVPNRKQLNAFYGKMIFDKIKEQYKLSKNNFNNYKDLCILIGRINQFLARRL